LFARNPLRSYSTNMRLCNVVSPIGAFMACLQVIVVSGANAPRVTRGGLDDSALTLIQASARVEFRTPRTPNPEPPRMYAAEGCDGSTATIHHAIRILAFHGIDAGADDLGREMLQYSSAHKHQKHFRDKNQTWVFKSILHRDMKETMKKDLKKMGTLGVYVTRRNPLDQLVCMIRDCFLNNEKYGYPVKHSGKKSNLCFSRRSKKLKDQALLRTRELTGDPHHPHNRSHLEENLQFMDELVSSGYTAFLKGGYKGPKIWYEDIMAFEKGGEANLQLSLKQWHDLLHAWGVTPSTAELRKYLHHYAHKWHQEKQQAAIHNYKEVADELKLIGRENLLRKD